MQFSVHSSDVKEQTVNRFNIVFRFLASTFDSEQEFFWQSGNQATHEHFKTS